MTTRLTQRVRHPKAEGYNISVDSDWFRTVTGPGYELVIGTRDSLAPRIEQRGSLAESVLDIGYAWARTDLSGGEGLDWDPREIALEREQSTLDLIRYWDSDGINVRRPDVSGAPYNLRLARDSRDWAGTVTDPKDLATSNNFIYIADGEDVSWYESWVNTTPIGTLTPFPGETIIAIAVSPNDTVMVTLTNGDAWVKTPNAGTFVEAYKDAGGALEAQGIWYVNGRFILSTFDTAATDVAELLVLEWDGTKWDPDNPIDTATAPFWSVVESGPAIVAACGDGTIRTYTPDNDASGTFELIPRGRTTMPEGESAILLGANAGVLLILTTADAEEADRQFIRMYQAEVLDARFDYIVGQLQLRRAWFGVEHEPLVTRNMATTRDEIFWFVREERQGLFYESLWRMDIVTGGFSRVISLLGVNLNGLVIFDSISGGIDFTNAKISIADEDFFQTSGWMIFPNVTFGLNTDISWLTAVIEAHDLDAAGTEVELWRTTQPEALLDWQDPSWVLIQRITTAGSSSIQVPLVNLKSRTISLQLRMKTDPSGLSTPRVTRTAIRGIPSHRDFIMMIPFNVSDYISVPGRKPMHVPGHGYSIQNDILSRIGDNVQVEILDPPVLFRGIMNNISEPVEYQSTRGSTTRYCMVEFRGQRVTEASLSVGNEGMGLGLLGVSLLGVEV